MDIVEEQGITFSTFICLCKCQGLTTDYTFHDAVPAPDFLSLFRSAIKECCSTACCSSPTPHCSKTRPYLVVSYSRKELLQTGDGHFSPIGAYDAASDMVLVLDTARFKYPPHWIHVEKLCAAMGRKDKSTDRSRGFAVLSYTEGGATAISTLVSIDVSSPTWRSLVSNLPSPPASLWDLMEHVWENGGIGSYLTPCLNPVLTSGVEACLELTSLVSGTPEFAAVEGWPPHARSQLASKAQDGRCCGTTQTLLNVAPTVLFTLLFLALQPPPDEPLPQKLGEEVAAIKSILASF